MLPSVPDTVAVRRGNGGGGGDGGGARGPVIDGDKEDVGIAAAAVFVRVNPWSAGGFGFGGGGVFLPIIDEDEDPGVPASERWFWS